jgi:hypothetical protein
MICERFSNCPFFKKHREDLAPTDYQLLMENYCRGALMSRCARLKYEQKNGHKPSDNLSPIGEYLR